jgi:hypothetical protein
MATHGRTPTSLESGTAIVGHVFRLRFSEPKDYCQLLLNGGVRLATLLGVDSAAMTRAFILLARIAARSGCGSADDGGNVGQVEIRTPAAEQVWKSARRADLEYFFGEVFQAIRMSTTRFGRASSG